MELALLIAALLPNAADTMPRPSATQDTPFIQEFHEAYPIAGEPEASELRAIAVDLTGRIWAGGKRGTFVLGKGSTEWTRVTDEGKEGSAYSIVCDDSGNVWVGAWDGLYVSRTGETKLTQIAGVTGPVTAVGESKGVIVAMGPRGMARGGPDGFVEGPLTIAQSVRHVLAAADGALWVSTGVGLYCIKDGSARLYQRAEEILSSSVLGAAWVGDELWAACMGGIAVFKNGQLDRTLTPKDGLPTIYAQCVATGPDGRAWVGTTLGVTRFDGKEWSLRHSRRWLMSDNVKAVAFDAEGTAWVATAKGVSAIKRRTMTLQEKATYFYDITMKRHVRDPWIVEKCALTRPGDLSSWVPTDDDNDGGYTGAYLMMESYRYAVTKDPQARENAHKAFETMRFLQTITETDGFFARTVVPSEWTKMHDPGDKVTPAEAADLLAEDPRAKLVEKRWRLSSDKKWRWKGDTSSDEMVAHFGSYPIYYDLAADDADREAIRGLVRKIMDHIIVNNYVLKDIDGTHTRWGMWTPDRLKNDPNWSSERYINSLEILSCLKTAWHITGDEKYQREYARLFHDEGLGELARHAKLFALACNTRIDDELLGFAYPALLRYETDPEMRAVYTDSVQRWYGGLREDQSPFFNFIFGGMMGADERREQSVYFLRDAPLDCIDWTVNNLKREDLSLVRAPIIEPLQTNRMLPASERPVVRWDKNPWEATGGDAGKTEWCPVFWLLPYWMGRYHGFIAAP